MTAARDELVNPPRRLPELTLRSLRGEGAHRLRSGRTAPVLLLVHGPDCEGCARYARALEARRSALEEWDGRVLAVVPGEAPADAAEGWPGGIPLLADPDRRVATTLSAAHPAVAVADQWGQLHAVLPAGEEHRFVELSEIEQWLRFLATRCPECEGEAL